MKTVVSGLQKELNEVMIKINDQNLKIVSAKKKEELVWHL